MWGRFIKENNNNKMKDSLSDEPNFYDFTLLNIKLIIISLSRKDFILWFDKFIIQFVNKTYYNIT